MTATYDDSTGNGSNKNFNYTFPILQTEDVKVALNSVVQATTKYTVNTTANPTRIEFNNTSLDSALQTTTGANAGAPLNGVTVRVYRETTVGKASGDDDPKAIYAAGSSIRAVDLNANTEQALYAIHELQDKPFLTDDISDGAITSSKIKDETIVNADISPTAQIAVNKLQDGSARQLLQTAANGTDVEWSSNIDIPGTLDVTGNADIDSNLNVDGTFTVAGAADLNGNLDVDGNTNLDNTTIDGYINVTGVATVDNVQIDGNEVRTTSGGLELDSQSGTVTVDDNLTVNGTSTLDNTTVDGVLDVNGSSTIDNVRIDGNEIDTTSGNLTIDSAGGTTTIDDNLVVSGTFSISNLNADTLDNLDSSQFLRSDTSDTFSATNHSLTFADDTHLKIGSGGDLAIHHDGNNTYITQTNSGQTYAAFTNGATFRTGANQKTVVKFVKNGGRTNVELYEGEDSNTATPTKRLETTSTGVTITGKTKTTSLEINGTDVTATALELNKLDGVTANTSELNKLDGVTATTTELNLLANKTIVPSIANDATDNQIPTAQAVSERIVELVTEVGGFHPIANETSFPTYNPDIDNNAGTIVSLKALSSSFSTGSGVTTHTFTNGAGSGNNVTITGLPASTTFPAGRGLLLETTTTSGNGSANPPRAYTYHRLTLDEAGVANAQAVVDDFDERYYGPFSANQATRPSGANRVNGDLYFNTSDGKMKVFNGSHASGTWDDVAAPGNFFINTLSSSSGSGGGSAAFNNNATRFTLSNPPLTAQQLLVSVNGVIQKPNSGTSPSEGFAIDGADIIFASAPATNAPFFIVTIGSSVNIGTPSNDTVGAAQIIDGSIGDAEISSTAGISKSKLASLDIVNADINASAAIAKSKLASLDIVNADINSSAAIAKSKLAALDIVNADVNSSAAIAGSKISPTFTSNVTISNTNPKLFFTDTNNDSDFAIVNNGGVFRINDETNSLNRFCIDSNGKVGIGTSNPQYNLHVVDSYHFTVAGGNSTTGMKIGNYDGSSYGKLTTRGSELRFDIGDTNKMILSSSGDLQLRNATTSHQAIQFYKDNSIGCSFSYGENNANPTLNIYRSDSQSGFPYGNLIINTGHFSNPTQALKLRTDKNIELAGNLIMASSKGIDFSATSDATGQSSELLDDYEEGVYTPGLSTGQSLNSSYDRLKYTKIGRQVTVTGQLVFNGYNTSNFDSVLQISLPFHSGDGDDRSNYVFPSTTAYFATSGTSSPNSDLQVVGLLLSANSNYLKVYGMHPNYDSTIGNWVGSGSDIWINITYFTN